MTERRRRDAPFASSRKARPQADGDSDFAGDRSAEEEDLAQQRSPENDGRSGVDNGATGDTLIRKTRDHGSRPPGRRS